MRIIYILFIASVLGYSCTPKVSEEVITETIEEVNEVEESEEVLTTCVTFDKLSSRDRDIAETSYVLYRDLVKLEKFEDALPYWKTGFSLAPAADGKIRYHFDDGIKIYKYYFDNADANEKEAYLDTIMAIYDKRIQCWPEEESHIAGRKAFDQFYYFNEYSSEDEIFNNFKTSIDSDPQEIDYFVINPFTKLLSDRISTGKIDLDEGRIYAYRLMDAIQNGVDSCKGSDCESWDIISNYAPTRLEALEGIDGLYDCDYYADKYYPVYEASPNDCDAIQLAYIRMVRGACDPNDPRMIEVKDAYNTNCKKETPSKGKLKEAYDLYTNADYSGAILKFNEYVTKTENVEEKTKYTFMIAKIYYRDIKNFPKAREFALKAASLQSGWGEPFMLIGKLYASSGPLCGPGTGFDSQVVTWVAIDKFKYAKSIDPSVSEEANKLIAQYEKYMPSKGDVFLRSIDEGSTYTVGCWIKEKTTVRVAK